MPRCLVSLGSNLGDTDAALDAAESALDRLGVRASLRVSTRHRTEPIGGPEGQQTFLNAVALFQFEGSPTQLHSRLRRIEDAADRIRTRRWGARSLDIDLLLFDEQVIQRSELRVPHPRMTFRPFVLEPAVEVAADWRHPECDATLEKVLRTLRHGDNCVRLIDDSGEVGDWIEATHADRVGIQTEPGGSRQPKLTIVASDQGAIAHHPGPRLVLADCPPEHWQDEVAAALQCVWPTPPR